MHNTVTSEQQNLEKNRSLLQVLLAFQVASVFPSASFGYLLCLRNIVELDCKSLFQL